MRVGLPGRWSCQEMRVAREPGAGLVLKCCSRPSDLLLSAYCYAAVVVALLQVCANSW